MVPWMSKEKDTTRVFPEGWGQKLWITVHKHNFFYGKKKQKRLHSLNKNVFAKVTANGCQMWLLLAT